jgi:trk/ktr system potassium uptake protein
MRPLTVISFLGVMLKPFAVLLLFPAAVDLIYGRTDKALVFVTTALASYLLGRYLGRLSRDASSFSRIEAMAVVAGSWLVAALLGCVPYMEQGFGFIDAFFESMSGFTTTGSTIFRPEHFNPLEPGALLSPGLIFWRAMTQWLGGMGIIVLFVAVLPALAVAGRQMFFAEAPGPQEDALTPRIRHTAAALWRLYITLTVLEAIFLKVFGGMTAYDAVCHAFTTLAAGGFSPHGESLAGYSATAQWIVIPFMFLAGANFALQYRAVTRPGRMFRDTEFRAYAGITIFVGILLAFLLAFSSANYDSEESIRHSLFQTASLLTTTGYASADFNDWDQGPLILMGCLLFIGGCAGSAGGGPKVVRYIVLVKFIAREMLVALHPRAVRPVSVGGRSVVIETLRQIIAFFVAYLLFFAVIAIATGIIENDFRVGLTGSIVTLGNIGPGYGAIGPMDTFADLHPITKILFIINMWVGRLEVMTVLVLFHPEVLRMILAGRRKPKVTAAKKNGRTPKSPPA